MGKHFNWPPFKVYAIDADTEQPIDPNVRMKSYVKYYDYTTDHKGRLRLTGKKTLAKGPIVDAAAKEAKKDGERKADTPANIDYLKVQRDTWLKEQDDTLVRMKDLKNNNKDIAAALQCSIGSCEKRYSQLTKDKKQGDQAKQDGNKNNQQQGKKGDKNNNQQQGNQNDKDAQKAGSDKAKKQSKDIKLDADDVFSTSDIEMLKMLLAKDQKQSALRLASALFDQTGRRVHPDDIEEKISPLMK